MPKKDNPIGLRVDDDVFEAIKALAHEIYEDDRHIATMARRLIIEALEARKRLKPKKK